MYGLTVDMPRQPGMPLQREVPPARLTTTLYDVCAALHIVLSPEDDALVVALVAHWLRSGRLTRTADGSASAAGGLAAWP